MAIGMSFHAMFNLVDLWMVGDFGEDAVAGVHCATTMNFLPMIVGNALSVATLAAMSQHLGAGRLEQARRMSSWSQYAMLVLGLVLGLIGAVLAVPSVDLQGATGAARSIGIDYLVVSSIGTVTMFALMQCTASMRANGEAWMPFALLVGANLLNIGLNFPLMYGLDALSIPALGPVGAAWASSLSRVLASVAGWIWLMRAAHPLRLSRPRWDVGPRTVTGLFELAWPQGVQMLARVAPVILLTRFAGEIAGNPAITALGVTTRLDTMVLFASIGFAGAATAVAGRGVGAGQPERARRAGWQAGTQSMLFAGLVIAALAVFAPSLIGWFVRDVSPAVRDAGTGYLRIAAWGHPLAAFCIAGGGAINGAGRTVPPMVLDLAGLLLLFLPAGSVLLSFAHEPQLVELWSLVIATQAVLLIGYALYLGRGGWLRGVASAARVTG